MTRTLVRLIAGAALIASLLAAAGCGGKAANERPVVVMIVDVSGSTKGLRNDGTFKKGITDTITQAAASEGRLWATKAEAATLANSSWIVNGGDGQAGNFKRGEGGDAYQTQVLKEAGQKLANSAQAAALIVPSGHPGSDLLGALQLAASIFKLYPNQPRALVMLTDGGINSRGVEWTANIPVSPAAQAAIINKLKASGELPQGGLTGGQGKPVNVWIGGLGHGMSGNGGRDAQSVKALWEKLVAAENGRLVDGGPSLNLFSFPNG